jgi:beta-glucoside operon transcriptional antiterminator
MKVVKKVNNNFAICLDNNGKELIAYGKGIGFPATPYELDDLSKIERTFYGIKSIYVSLIDAIPEEVIQVSSQIVDEAMIIVDRELNSNIVFTLADHITFAIQRKRDKMNFKTSFCHEIKHLYTEEMDIGYRAIALIKEKLDVDLSEEEAASIALHFINAQKIQQVVVNEIDEKEVIMDITTIIENDFAVTINREGFNYSRFVSHIQYLLKRRENDTSIVSNNQVLFATIKTEFIQAYLCANHIKEYVSDKLLWNISEEELIYMILHINRLCIREDCHR